MSSDLDMEEFENEQKIIESMFPCADFTISIELKDFDDIVSDKDTIFIKQTFDCYCYENKKPIKTKYFKVINKDGVITNKTILEVLYDKKCKLNCNHRYIEGFTKINDSDTYDICTGS
jgi:hypothetical protein